MNYTDLHLHRARGVRLRRRASTPATTPRSTATTSRPGTTRSAPTAIVKVDPTLAHPRCVYQLMKQHYARYTPEMVERVCGTPKDEVPADLRDDRLDRDADARDDHHVRARLDAALGRLADDPHRRDGAAAARQYRCVRRRHERAARAFEHPGTDRPRSDVEPAAGLHHAAGREGAGLRQVHGGARLQAAAAESAELLAELRQVLRQLHEGVVGRCGHRGEPLGLRLSAQARQALRHAADRSS